MRRAWMPNPVRILTKFRVKESLPAQVRLRDFDPDGISFEISNPIERYRVMEYGGEPEYLRAMLTALRADDVLFDVGANVGMVALHAAKRCRVIAFEPDPSFAMRVRKNLSLNPSIDVELLPLAISDEDGEVMLFTDGAGGNSPSLRHQRQEKGSVTVAARSIDSLVAERGLAAPTILKLDIEGAEILALRGARELLRSPHRPRALFLEVHPEFLPAFGSSETDVMRIVGDAGYTRVTYQAVRAGECHYILETP